MLYFWVAVITHSCYPLHIAYLLCIYVSDYLWSEMYIAVDV